MTQKYDLFKMSTYLTRANIFIGGIKINKYKSIKVQKSLDGSSCTVTYPDNLQINGKYLYRTGSDNNPMSTGQYIYIDMGWDKLLSDDFKTTQNNTYFDAVEPSEDNTSQFIGFISKITQNFKTREITVECEDYNYLLKRISFDFSVRKITLKELGDKIIKKLPTLDISMNNDPNDFIFADFSDLEVVKGLDFTLQKFTAEKSTGYDILTHLSDEYNIRCVWYGSKLIMGVNYLNPNTGSEKEFRFTQTPRIKQTTDMLYALDTGGLVWQNSKDVKYQITANIINKTLDRTEYKLGDLDGAEREFWFYGDYTKKDVEGLVSNELSRLKYDGFKEGSTITSFGEMNTDYKQRGVNILDTITLDGIDYRTETDGQKTVLPSSSYLCKGVSYTIDNKGFGCEITLGQVLPIVVKSFYEKDPSFNVSNLSYVSTYIDFTGETKFDVATGKTSVQKVIAPVIAPKTDIKILKNLLGEYKTINKGFNGLLDLQTGYLEDLGSVHITNTHFDKPIFINKTYVLNRLGSQILNYSYISTPNNNTTTYYNPKFLNTITVSGSPHSLKPSDVFALKNFNKDTSNLEILGVSLLNLKDDIKQEEVNGATWDLSKLTNEEKFYYDAIKSTTDTSIIIEVN